jgi:DNA-binding beta-propeller fold protein YncE
MIKCATNVSLIVPACLLTTCVRAALITGSITILLTCSNPTFGDITRLDFDAFPAHPGTLADSTGQGTGFTVRLPGSGASIPANDPNLTLDALNSHLVINSTRSDFNTTGFGRNLNAMEAPAIFVPGIGNNDFIIRATFLDLHVDQASDQIGVFAGTSVDNLARSMIAEGPGSYQSAYTDSHNGADGLMNGAVLGTFHPGDDAIIELGRIGGVWHFRWQNLNSPQLSGILGNFTIPSVDSQNDLYFGVFNHDARNTVHQIATLDSFEISTGSSVPKPVPHFYWTDPGGAAGSDLIRRANEDGSGIQTVATSLQAPRGLALDPIHQRMYWSDPGAHAIQVGNLDGSGPIQNVVPTGNAAAGVALDVPSGKLYWTDAENLPGMTGRIRRANLDGSSPDSIVTGLMHPAGLALDPGHGKVYWTELDSKSDGLGSIQRANLDGSNVETILTGIDEANGLAIDPIHGKLYWPELTTKRIQSSNLDGSDVHDLVTGIDSPTSVALDLAASKIYWTNSGGSQSNQIDIANLDGSGIHTLVSGVGAPWGIAVAVVPEPSAFMLAALGTIGIVIGGRRRSDPCLVSAARHADSLARMYYNPLSRQKAPCFIEF